MVDLVRPLERTREHSPFAAARLQRKLTAFEAARRAGLSVDQVQWLEEGRVYRFRSPDDALAAAVVYARRWGSSTARRGRSRACPSRRGPWSAIRAGG